MSEIKTHVPSSAVKCGTEIEIRYESQGFPLLPGCMVFAELEFSWQDRLIKGRTLCRPGGRNGIIRIRAGKHGNYSSPGAYYSISDAAGFFRFRAAGQQPRKLRVIPQPAENTEMPRIMSAGGNELSRTRRKKRGDEFLDTRQYYPGDDVRRINWKTFAHLGELFIRLGEELPDPDSHLMIIPDFSGPAEDLLNPEQRGSYIDYLVSVLTGITGHLIDSGVSTVVLLPDGTTADAAMSDFASGLWWNNRNPGKQIIDGNKYSCLIVSSAFSVNAAAVCSYAVKNGMPATVVVPLPENSSRPARQNLFSRMLFLKEPLPEYEYTTILRPQADTLLRELSGRKGVVSAEII